MCLHSQCKVLITLIFVQLNYILKMNNYYFTISKEIVSSRLTAVTATLKSDNQTLVSIESHKQDGILRKGDHLAPILNSSKK